MKYLNFIMWTTDIDINGNEMSKEALDDMCLQCNEKYIPLTDKNNNVGVVLYGQVFAVNEEEEEDSVYALGVVAGKFENDKEREVFKAGDINKSSANKNIIKKLNVNLLKEEKGDGTGIEKKST